MTPLRRKPTLKFVNQQASFGLTQKVPTRLQWKLFLCLPSHDRSYRLKNTYRNTIHESFKRPFTSTDKACQLDYAMRYQGPLTSLFRDLLLFTSFAC